VDKVTRRAESWFAIARGSRKNRAMRHPAIEPLLILQDRDLARRGLETQLAKLPAEAAAVEGHITAEQAASEKARQEVRELETKKKLLETEIGGAEDKLAKYRTQQMSVRKNDEYQALGHEIETMEKTIGTLEEQELEIMYAIDAARERLATAERQMQANIAGHRAKLAAVSERKVSLEAELATVVEAVATAREPLAEPALRLYDRVVTRHLPAVVAMRTGKCDGCHLRVSGEVESEARKGEELVTCDQCGRVVWFEQ
jgi:predicted  nucleic acid-binding Zn-ribbon protein